MAEIPIKTLKDLTLLADNFLDLFKYIGLTEQQAKHPNAAEWLIEELKNNDTSILLKMKLNLMRRIDEDLSHSPLDNPKM